MNSTSITIIVTGISVFIVTAQATAKAKQADFNGDGRADLAIGVPGETVAGFESAGGVAVIYGKNSSGLNADGDQFWTQDSSGVNGVPSEGDAFGSALAVGDFDGDGFSDLAIGAIGDEINGVDGAGAVNVLYGSSSGLRSSGDQLWHRDVDGVDGDLQISAQFGIALAAGDFDDDGRDDLAIGIRQQDVNAGNAAGEVHVLYGSNSGLSADGDQVFNQDTGTLHDDAEDSDFFGVALAAGDFDGDGRDDLAIGVPGEDAGAGAVEVLYGTSSGLDDDGSQFFTQDLLGDDDETEGGDFFGNALACGDFDNNGKDDLAIGAPLEGLGGKAQAGVVHVLYGSSNGLRDDNADYWNQDTPGIPGAPEDVDRFGFALATGDFDNNGRDDLAIGVQNERLDGDNTGAVHVLYGGSGGLTATGDQFWSQDSTDIRDSAEENDVFGSALAVGDFDNDNRDDLAIGVSGETFSGLGGAGAVNVIYGKNSSGLHRDGNQFWHQDSSGVNDSPVEGENFGISLR